MMSKNVDFPIDITKERLNHRLSELIVKYNIGLKTSATGHIRTYILC